MPLLAWLARTWLLNRLLRAVQGRPRGHGSARSHRHGSRYRSRRSRARGGFVGPFPYYSTRTRRGSRVSVGGCCLPIPLALSLVVAAAARALVRH
jgi:hypothetical protein